MICILLLLLALQGCDLMLSVSCSGIEVACGLRMAWEGAELTGRPEGGHRSSSTGRLGCGRGAIRSIRIGSSRTKLGAILKPQGALSAKICFHVFGTGAIVCNIVPGECGRCGRHCEDT